MIKFQNIDSKIHGKMNECSTLNHKMCTNFIGFHAILLNYTTLRCPVMVLKIVDHR